MSDRSRLGALLLTMTVVTAGVLAITLWLLYRTVYNEERNRVIDLAHSQVRLIQAVTRFDSAYSQADHTDGALGATISQIIDAHTQHHRLDDGIEIEIARREGDVMMLLLDPIGDTGKFETLPWDSEFGIPLRRALEGQSGAMESIDHHGEPSLTAYAPVPELKIAIVAKIDIGRIQAPFLKAALLSAAGATVIFVLGIFLFRRIGNPILERMEQTVERLNKSQRIARLGNWELDLRTEKFWWSDETYRLLGVDQDNFHPNLETFTALIHPEDRALAAKHTAEAAETGMPFKYDHRVIRPDGSIRTLHEQCTVTTDTLGNPILLTGTAQDVTEKREFETLTTRFGRIIEQSVNEIYVFDSETLKFVQVNYGGRKNLGYTMDELRD
ncbi:MAG: PAS domain-containing protein, partial [Rhodospirillales bacterium]|nr:PAS domain-containing protein [Rhodospirillales bacterium]